MDIYGSYIMLYLHYRYYQGPSSPSMGIAIGHALSSGKRAALDSQNRLALVKSQFLIINSW